MTNNLFLLFLLFSIILFSYSVSVSSSSASSCPQTETAAATAAEAAAAEDIARINALFEELHTFGRLANNDSLLVYNNIEIKRSQFGGMGVFATKDLIVGEPFITLPSTCFLNHSRIWTHPRFIDVVKPLLDQELIYNSSSFALWLWEESHNPSSPWKHYLKFLPQSFSNSYYITDDDFELVEKLIPAASSTGENIKLGLQESRAVGINAYNIIKEKIYNNQSNYKPEGFYAPTPTYEEFRYYLSAVASRAWSLDQELTLIPLLDLVNHDPAMLAPFFDPDFVITYANRNFSKGEELFHSYGPKSNWDLLITYGFVPDYNIANSYGFTVNANPQYPYIIMEHGLTMAQNISYDGAISNDLLNLFRLIHLTTEEKPYHNNIKDNALISWRNEREALHGIIALTKQFLSEMPTPLDDDKLLLEKAKKGEIKISEFGIAFIQYIISQKIMLMNAISSLENYWLALLHA